jgi:hypothetical protein
MKASPNGKLPTKVLKALVKKLLAIHFDDVVLKSLKENPCLFGRNAVGILKRKTDQKQPHSKRHTAR